MTMSQLSDSIETIRNTAAQLTSDDHPNPLLRRADWQTLDGTWHFSVDPDNHGLEAGWQESPLFKETILVPYVPETVKSGLQSDPGRVFWYHRAFCIPDAWRERRVILHFGAVDYEAMVFVNGQYLGSHQGGYTPFAFDITQAIRWIGDNQLVVRVVDTAGDMAQPRGKQTWKSESEGILYTRTSGIWQSVWIEPRGSYAVASVTLTPDRGTATVEVHAEFTSPLPLDRSFRLSATVTSEGSIVGTAETKVQGGVGTLSVALHSNEAASATSLIHAWSPDDPHLYSITIHLHDENGSQDVIESYFGVRTLSVTSAGLMALNGAPLYLRMLLDQGYFPESGLTGTDRQFREDILLVKAMGFNGVRKHQKIEDPRFLYWCDRLGLMVWEEMPSAYLFHPIAIERLVTEWLAILHRDMGHPAIIAWVPFNESWGFTQLSSNAQQKSYAEALYHLTKALDSSRWVIANDGWEHVQTDLITIHDYQQDPTVLSDHYQNRADILELQPANRPILVSPALDEITRPILVTECGGATVIGGPDTSWGYGTVHSLDELATTYSDLIEAIQQSPVLQGYCYTQFTDVEQEQNGLTTIDRMPKIPIAVIRQSNLRAPRITQNAACPAAPPVKPNRP